MNIRTKFYGISSFNARYDCPFCGETRGRFYINVSKSSKQGLYVCHNCNRKGRVEKEGEIAFFSDYEEELPVTDTYLQYKTMLGGKVLKDFLHRRGIHSNRDDLQITVSQVINFREEKPLEHRLLLPCKSINGKKSFFNLRAVFPGIDPKVLFSASRHNNIAKKSECVLWNPEIKFMPANRTVVPVVCEGDMGAWSIWKDTGKELFIGVAVLGKFVSATQGRYLGKFKKILLMPDMDQSDFEIEQNLRRLLYGGCEEVLVYDKSQYAGPKDDANDILQRDKNFFDETRFKTINIL